MCLNLQIVSNYCNRLTRNATMQRFRIERDFQRKYNCLTSILYALQCLKKNIKISNIRLPKVYLPTSPPITISVFPCCIPAIAEKISGEPFPNARRVTPYHSVKVNFVCVGVYLILQIKKYILQYILEHFQ